ncbi:DNA-binding protein [Thermococcus sp. CX2]|uniref:DNA-binding protein n=1 Tax=Thermococcus sp. CX2 TaxID=163006 RepID=UPI00143C4E4D|nr:DNA-binding protein [Thermococcus sp. CX2]NJE85439.1 DNA-binding protein [Thermococcus sp. CX2]
MEDIENQVLSWLKEGDDAAKDIVDLPWSITNVGQGVYMAEHPRMPFTLLVMFSEGFVHLIVPLRLETLAMTKDERLKVYHTLLLLNDRVNLMKFTLSGMNDEVYLRVDLDKKSLGKEEFNDALAALLIGLQEAVTVLGIEEAFAQEVFDRIVWMVYERIQKGATKEELLRFLVAKVGMPESDAKKLLNEILAAQEEAKRNAMRENMYL